MMSSVLARALRGLAALFPEMCEWEMPLYPPRTTVLLFRRAFTPPHYNSP
jgi:hypothetical protein